MSTGDIIAILNFDDFYCRRNVLERVERVLQNPEIDACYGDLVYLKRFDSGQVELFHEMENLILNKGKIGKFNILEKGRAQRLASN